MTLAWRIAVISAVVLLTTSCGASDTVRGGVVTRAQTGEDGPLFDDVRDPHAAFVAPSPWQRDAFAAWATAAVVAPSLESVPSPPAPFVIRAVPAQRDVIAVTESGSTVGGGAYLLRVGAAPAVVVEVPHSFADRFTLPIGVALFDGLHGRALLVNTVHRYRGAGSAREDEVRPSDMAHTQESYFHAFHVGAVQALPGVVVIAVHGFSATATDPDVIVSNGRTTLSAASVAQALRAHFPDYRVGLFPTEIDRLGGTQGVQAKHLREVGGGMLHLELSGRLREDLRADGALRKRFAEAVAEGLGVAP